MRLLTLTLAASLLLSTPALAGVTLVCPQMTDAQQVADLHADTGYAEASVMAQNKVNEGTCMFAPVTVTGNPMVVYSRQIPNGMLMVVQVASNAGTNAYALLMGLIAPAKQTVTEEVEA